MIAPINKIIDFSTVDGEGLRTSVFFQGCNISCLYCHNPETKRLCNSCLKCVALCSAHALSVDNGKVLWDKNKCISCDTCIKECEYNSSPKISYMSAIEVFDIIKKNMPFIRGITVSGGECMLYPKFLEELFSLAKKNNLSTLIDSNGMVLYEDYSKLLELTDGVMLDVKAFNDSIYHKLTGYHNDNVKRNLLWLYEHNKIEELRIVYVKGYVDAIDILNGIKEILHNDIKNIKIKLITFRNNGVKSILSNYPSPSKEEMNEIASYAKELGFNNIIIR